MEVAGEVVTVDFYPRQADEEEESVGEKGEREGERGLRLFVWKLVTKSADRGGNGGAGDSGGAATHDGGGE